MKRKVLALFIGAALALSSALTPVFAAQGTDGNELQVAEAQKLEIHGKEWSGVNFTLRTDSGLYPDNIPVGEDGVLRLEIGGSSSYILSCLQTDEPKAASEAAAEPAKSEQDAETESNVRGIPIRHIIIFGGGMLLAGGTLLAFKLLGNKQIIYSDDDDDLEPDDDDEK